jgi:hypothetical protein
MRTISNGVFTLHDLLGFVTTDASGNIVSWDLIALEPKTGEIPLVVLLTFSNAFWNLKAAISLLLISLTMFR